MSEPRVSYHIVTSRRGAPPTLMPLPGTGQLRDSHRPQSHPESASVSSVAQRLAALSAEDAAQHSDAVESKVDDDVNASSPLAVVFPTSSTPSVQDQGRASVRLPPPGGNHCEYNEVDSVLSPTSVTNNRDDTLGTEAIERDDDDNGGVGWVGDIEGGRGDFGGAEGGDDDEDILGDMDVGGFDSIHPVVTASPSSAIGRASGNSSADPLVHPAHASLTLRDLPVGGQGAISPPPPLDSAQASFNPLHAASPVQRNRRWQSADEGSRDRAAHSPMAAMTPERIAVGGGVGALLHRRPKDDDSSIEMPTPPHHREPATDSGVVGTERLPIWQQQHQQLASFASRRQVSSSAPLPPPAAQPTRTSSSQWLSHDTAADDGSVDMHGYRTAVSESVRRAISSSSTHDNAHGESGPHEQAALDATAALPIPKAAGPSVGVNSSPPRRSESRRQPQETFAEREEELQRRDDELRQREAALAQAESELRQQRVALLQAQRQVRSDAHAANVLVKRLRIQMLQAQCSVVAQRGRSPSTKGEDSSSSPLPRDSRLASTTEAAPLSSPNDATATGGTSREPAAVAIEKLQRELSLATAEMALLQSASWRLVVGGLAAIVVGIVLAL